MYKQEHLWNTPFARRSYQQKNAAIAVTNQISMYTNKAALRFPVKQIFLSCPERKIEAKSPTFVKILLPKSDWGNNGNRNIPTEDP